MQWVTGLRPAKKTASADRSIGGCPILLNSTYGVVFIKDDVYWFRNSAVFMAKSRVAIKRGDEVHRGVKEEYNMICEAHQICTRKYISITIPLSAFSLFINPKSWMDASQITVFFHLLSLSIKYFLTGCLSRQASQCKMCPVFTVFTLTFCKTFICDRYLL